MKTPKGLFIKNGRWYFHASKEGAVHKKSTELKATRENMPVALKMRADFIRNNHVKPMWFSYKVLTLKEAITLYLASLRVRDSTYEGYKWKLEQFEKYVGSNIHINRITAQSFFDYLNSRVVKEEGAEIPLSQNTQANYSRHIRLLFNWLVKNKYLETNPIPLIKGVVTSVRIITPDEKAALFGFLEKHNPAGLRFVKVMDFTGMRPGEVKALRWEQFDFNNKVLNIWNSKEQRNDQFPLYKNFYNFLKPLRQESGLVFPELQLKWSQNFFKRACRKLGLKVSIYDMRRTFGTDMASRMNEIELAALMRHRSIETTRRYYISLNLHKTAMKIDR